MKVFITGGTGFIGSHLAEKLLNEGYEVKVLTRSSSDTTLLESLGIEIVYGNLMDLSSLEKEIKGCRHVYHLAANTTLLGLPKTQYYSVNIKGTENVLYGAMKAQVDRLVYCSTTGVYGMITKPPVDENTNTNPNSHYRKSKLLGENVALSFHKNHGLPVVVARIGSIYGPRSFNWLKLFQTVSKKRFRMIGSGENHLHMCYVTDVVEGLKLCANVDNIEGKTYIIAGKEPIKLKHLIDLIARELEIKCSYPTLPESPFHLFKSLSSFIYKSLGYELPFSNQIDFFLGDKNFNISKAQIELGYSPKVSMKEGIHNTVNWYREKGYI